MSIISQKAGSKEVHVEFYLATHLTGTMITRRGFNEIILDYFFPFEAIEKNNGVNNSNQIPRATRYGSACLYLGIEDLLLRGISEDLPLVNEAPFCRWNKLTNKILMTQEQEYSLASFKRRLEAFLTPQIMSSIKRAQITSDYA